MVGNASVRLLLIVLLLGLTMLFVGPVRAQAIQQPGSYQPGTHLFPYGAQVFPPDALAGGMRPLRRIIPWETGSLISISTTVHYLRDGRRSGSIALTASQTPGMAEGYLRPGVYEVVTTTHTQHWQWVDRPPFEMHSGHYLVKETQHSSTHTASYVITIPSVEERPHPCDNTELREGIKTPEAEALREAVAAAMAALGARIGPEHVVVHSPHRSPEQSGFDLLTYTVPLQMTDNQPRHNMICLMDKMAERAMEPGTLVGAGEMVFGMVQEVGGQTRVNMRRTNVETGMVLDAGMSTVNGTGRDAVNQATAEAAADALVDLPFL